MKISRISFLCLGLGISLLGSSTFALELNSSNIGTYCGSIYKTYCNIVGQDITRVAPGTFKSYIYLTSISLQDNQISSIESGAFEGPSDLGISLYNNKVTDLKDLSLTSIKNLKVLNLDNNQITSIGSGAFSGLSVLQTLYLSNNQINNIEDGAFSRLSALKFLYLDNNQINSIKTGLFSGLTSICAIAELRSHFQLKF